MGDIISYIKEIKKSGSVTSFRTIFNGYVAKKLCAEMLWLKQIFQITTNATVCDALVTHTGIVHHHFIHFITLSITR